MDKSKKNNSDIKKGPAQLWIENLDPDVRKEASRLLVEDTIQQARKDPRTSEELGEELFGKLSKLDDIVAHEAGGCYTLPYSKDSKSYDLRALDQYAKNNNKNTSELTEEELKQFIVKK